MAEVLQKRTDPRTIIKEKNAIKAQRAREKYHSMSEEKRKTYNKKRNIYWIRQKEREARILQKKLSEASAQDLEHLEKIIEERERRAEAQRRRYYTKSFEERRAMNHKLYLKRKKQQYGSSTSGALAGAYVRLGNATPRKDAVPFDKAGIRYLSQKVIASVWDQEQLESASVFLYDPITKGWLYRVSNTSFPAGRQRRKNMHHIHTTQGKLMNLASMGNSVLMATECDAAGGCRYIVNFLQIMAFSPHACVFKSETLMAVGLLTDVRSEDPQDTEGKDVSPVILTPEQVEHRRPVSQGYEPIIALATHSLANLHQAEDICAAKAS
ncbi:hypothetical protein QR680_006124 [Steinernema hermaphroditum]|uniref:Uncharacterized protein n=1 Tax=Steinernema hermaphroditum TaxID=289476 RepID=A0AA39HWQ1_9BILA|nr:hypothetical protein QR680_006124 [Steinernema hermaphroditum]